ncbi:hypothetical protein [Selenomonas sp. ND2010]|uniref:hypothetical protein n=1 Tax=Selenomonas sp. ND2010 TaxID=1410618 RepID=UPI00051B3F38|nr:hypothetical protein [Selenomonas sp. ND2010]
MAFSDKILFISLYEPNKYGGRVGGTVILINDILSAVDSNYDVDLIVYKKDDIESDLPQNVKFRPWSSIARKDAKWSLKSKLPKGLYKDYSSYFIDAEGYSKIVFYPYFCSLFNLENAKGTIYTIGMDSGPMLYLRGYLNHKNVKNKLFCLYEYFQALSIDKKAASVSQKVFCVGETDAAYYRCAYSSDARFVHHPVTSLIDSYTPIKWEYNQKLKLCFPGGMTEFYTKGLAEKIIDLIGNESNYFKDKIEISFLGQVKYSALKNSLAKVTRLGISVNYTEFAKNFEEYLSNQHLILLPLVVGVGTKNKTLSSLGMGLDMIGTPIAMENVYGVRDIHVAKDAFEFLWKIKKRIEQRKLFGLSSDEIDEFKKYHSVSNWRTSFWGELN